MAATVGVAMGQRSEVTTEAAGAVILDNSLGKVDELMHIGRRMRAIALQCAVGGIALSLLGNGRGGDGVAAAGLRGAAARGDRCAGGTQWATGGDAAAVADGF